METLHTLWTWTPYLLQGLGWNLLIATCAMVLGTAAGAGLARLRVAHRRWLRRGARVASGLCRNAPTIVFQFYLAMMLPAAWGLAPWFKASLALALAVVGFTCDNLVIALKQWRAGQRGAALLFVPSWATYLVIIVLASSTASIIGVNELVSRSNAVVNASGDSGLMIPIYLYAMVMFFVLCWPLVALLTRLRAALARRLDGTHGPKTHPKISGDECHPHPCRARARPRERRPV